MMKISYDTHSLGTVITRGVQSGQHAMKNTKNGITPTIILALGKSIAVKPQYLKTIILFPQIAKFYLALKKDIETQILM